MKKLLSYILSFFFIFPQMGYSDTLSKVNETQPMSIEDINCGEYIIGARFQITGQGEDFLYLYPGTDREFAVPLSGLKAEESLNFDGVVGNFSVSYPLENGKKQGRFYFKKFLNTSNLSKISQEPIKKIGSSCKK